MVLWSIFHGTIPTHTGSVGPPRDGPAVAGTVLWENKGVGGQEPYSSNTWGAGLGERPWGLKRLGEG